jgi:hypothetical protein
MGNLDITQTSTTSLDTKVDNFSVASKVIDQATSEDTIWANDHFDQNLSYYLTIPEYKKAIDTYATWVLGRGYTCDANVKLILEDVRGWGEDTFLSILWNMLVVKKFHGDSYAEIIRDEDGEMINLKPLNPRNVKHVCSKKVVLKHYLFVKNDNKEIKIDKKDMLHLCNDRIADEIHGRSVGECVKWIIDARNEAMSDVRRIAHRSTIRILYIEEDNKERLTSLKTDYADAMNKGELLILPIAAGDGSKFEDLSTPPIQQIMEWIAYLENFFYQAVGVPKSIVGGVQDTTEAASKVGMVVFDPIYLREITDLQEDLWNQLPLRINFTGQKSMMDNVQTDESKNTGQTKLEMQGGQ